MDNSKICFIYCVNNEELLAESWRHIEMLNVPPEYTIENRVARGFPSMAAGYNWGMVNSDAKYKVYLHQDVNIIDPAFLHSILYYFMKYPRLGLLGVIGAKILPQNGIWWESPYQYGKVYHFDRLRAGAEVVNELEPVQVVDGLIMMTQYDLRWRDEIFQGWHFYDASQCMEFIKAGYSVAVPKQPQPWCVHNSKSTLHGYMENQQLFLREYRHLIG